MTDNPPTKSNDDLATDDYRAKHAAADALNAELEPLNRAALFDALAAARITHATVTFDGYSDSGQIENIECKAGDTIVPMPGVQIDIAYAQWGEADPQHEIVGVAHAMESFAYDLLEQTHCGWENDDGAYGYFTFDVANRTITLDYNERFIDSTYSQHVF
jgi:hypothetical protein